MDTTVGTLAGIAPLPITQARVERVTGGARLLWSENPAASGQRILIHVERGSGAEAGAIVAKSLLAVEPAPRDPGGAIDSAAKPGIPQRYTLVREQTVALQGETFSISSAPTVVTLAASSRPAPPTAPAGLEGIAVTLNTPEIDLVWQASPDASGYKLYRSAGSAEPALLTSLPLRNLTFSDTAVQPGTRYRYSVSAVNADGMEGPRSRESAVTIPQP